MQTLLRKYRKVSKTLVALQRSRCADVGDNIDPNRPFDSRDNRINALQIELDELVTKLDKDFLGWEDKI